MLNTSPIDRTFDWIKRECTVAQDLYAKVLEEIDEEDKGLEDLIPTPIEYWMNAELFKTWWDNLKETAQSEFKKKHAWTIEQLEKQKEDNITKLTMTDDQKLEFYIAQDKEIARKRAAGERVFIEPDEEYLADQKALRGFFNCTLAVYMALLSTILDLVLSDEFDFIEIDFEKGMRLEECLVNTIEPHQNYYYKNKFLEDNNQDEVSSLGSLDDI